MLQGDEIKMIRDRLRDLPAVDKLIDMMVEVGGLQENQKRSAKEAARSTLSECRRLILAGEQNETGLSDLIKMALEELHSDTTPNLRAVINATGVILHTNLGRAPLSERARQQLLQISDAYSTLEFNLVSGERGSRYEHVAAKICQLTGAEEALVVNNNAAAVLLTLSTLAAKGEVIVSRGELVEIGGSFRIPEVINRSGCRLIEVGTTNRTTIEDFRAAVNENTVAILRVHTSNYRIIGFTSQPTDEEFLELARSCGVLLINDLGSGAIQSFQMGGVFEPAVKDVIARGYDVVTFSGDKLFGGPQAGIIAGKRNFIEKIKKNQLLRALRIGKLSLAALEGTLRDYIDGKPEVDIPVHRMLNRNFDAMQAQAGKIVERLALMNAGKWTITAEPTASQAGGGSLPEVDVPGWGVFVSAVDISADKLRQQLRNNEVPIIARIIENRLVIDVRCLSEVDVDIIVAALTKISGGK